jgi:hypothetical protein
MAKLTLFLLVVAAVLGAVLYCTDEQPRSHVVAETSLLDGRSLRDCQRIRWQFQGMPAIEVRPDAEVGAKVTEPIVDVAAVSYLRQIVAAFDSAQLVATDFADEPKGRQETGLLTPELTVWIDWPDGTKLVLDIGAPAISREDRFVRRSGRIYRASTALLESLRVGLDDLRERAVFRLMEPLCTELRVDHVAVTGKREPLHLRRQNGAWQLVAPKAGRADPLRAAQFVTSVLSLRADQFLPGLFRPPERPADIRILVRGEGGEQSAEFWTEQAHVFGLMPGRGVVFQSDPRQYDQIFLNAAQDFRAGVLLPMASVAAQCAEVLLDPGQGGVDRVRLRRETDGTEWRLLEPVELRTAPTPVAELLQGLNNLRAIEFVEGATSADPATGLGPGRLQVSVREFDHRELVTLWLGAPVTKNGLPLCHACRADEPDTVVLVPGPAAELLRRAWPIYVRRDVVELTVPIERLQLVPRLGAAAAARRFGQRDGRWYLEGASEPRDELAGLVQDVLRDLRGKECVDLRHDPFDGPDWTLDLQRENSDLLLSLQVWDRGKDAPFVVRMVPPLGAPGPVGYVLEPFVAKALRDLWQ